MLHGWVLVTVGAVDVDEAVVEKLPERVPVTCEVIEPEMITTVPVPRVSVSVALSVADATSDVRVVVARVRVLLARVYVGVLSAVVL